MWGGWQAGGKAQSQEGKMMYRREARALRRCLSGYEQMLQVNQPDGPVLYLASTYTLLLPAGWLVSKIKSSFAGREGWRPSVGTETWLHTSHSPTGSWLPMEGCGGGCCAHKRLFPILGVPLPFPDRSDFVWQTGITGCCHGEGYDVTRE